MNLNLSSVFNISSLKDVSKSEAKAFNFDKLIKIVVAISFFVLALVSRSLIEYISVAIVFYVAQLVYSYYMDLTNIDLHFTNDDIELNEIINDLWN